MISSLVCGSRFVSNVSSVSLLASSISGKAEGIGLLRTSLKFFAHLSSCFSCKVILFPFLSLMIELPLLYFPDSSFVILKIFPLVGLFSLPLLLHWLLLQNTPFIFSYFLFCLFVAFRIFFAVFGCNSF